MVNEINKTSNENAALSERLAASNRQLQEMQEEHRQLLLEMETLRLRAAELGRLNANVQQQRQQRDEVSTIETTTAAAAVSAAPLQTPAVPEEEQEPTNPTTDTNSNIEETQTQTSNDNNTAVTTEATENNMEKTATTEPATSEDSEETANYLQDKLAEIARLKSQFKRVQNMIDTTNLIEQHIAAKEAAKIKETESSLETRSAVNVSTAAVPVSTPATTASTAATDSVDLPQSVNQAEIELGENRELLNTMLTMFTDFTSDLRGQAESLRAERERIKLLRDELVRRRQQK